MNLSHQEKDLTHNDSTDCTDLVRAVMQDIGAIFEVIAGREKQDATTKSLCTTGIYLCDKWADLITGEIQQGSAPPPSKQQLGDLVLQRNRKPIQEIAPTGF